MMLTEGDAVDSMFRDGRVRTPYVVSGFTVRGKVRLTNLRTGSNLTAWWGHAADLPPRYTHRPQAYVRCYQDEDCAMYSCGCKHGWRPA